MIEYKRNSTISDLVRSMKVAGKTPMEEIIDTLKMIKEDGCH